MYQETEQKMRLKCPYCAALNMVIKGKVHLALCGICKKKLKPDHYSQYEFSHLTGLAIVQFHEKFGYIHMNDGSPLTAFGVNFRIPPIYDDVYPHIDSKRARVKYKGKWGHIDTTGSVITPFLYDHVLAFQEDRAAVQKNGKWGYVDSKGELITPLKYDNCYFYSEDYGKVELNGLYGFVDGRGEEIIPCRFVFLNYFNDGVCEATVRNNLGRRVKVLINRRGKIIDSSD